MLQQGKQTNMKYFYGHKQITKEVFVVQSSWTSYIAS